MTVTLFYVVPQDQTAAIRRRGLSPAPGPFLMFRSEVAAAASLHEAVTRFPGVRHFSIMRVEAEASCVKDAEAPGAVHVDQTIEPEDICQIKKVDLGA